MVDMSMITLTDMSKTKWLFFFLLTTLDLLAAPQDSIHYKHQISLLVDNDVFTSLWRDQYYSSGLFGTYSWLKEQSEHKKTIRSVSLVQRMFTPRLVTWDVPELFDRPYAGHLSTIFSIAQLRHDRVWKHQFELGWMGPGSLTGKIQETWHNMLGLPPPNGWEYEIQNSPIINYYGSLGARILGNGQLELLNETHLAVGTTFNHLRTEMLIKAGRFKNLMQSVHYNGQFGTKKSEQRSEFLEEIVLFYAPGVEYNFFNSTIEGNPLGKEPSHTEKPIRWIGQHRFGLLLGWKGFDLTVNYYRRTKETTESTSHQYAGVQLARRF
jgi:lipid A 3-O-deacylase